MFFCDKVSKALNGIARSTNGGKTWAFGTVGTSSKDSTTYSHSVDFKDALVGVAARDDSTFWSTSDGGVTWQQIGSKAPTYHWYIEFVQGTNTAMAGGVNLATIGEVDLDSRTFIENHDVAWPNISFSYVDFPNLRRGYMTCGGMHRAFFSIVYGTSEVLTETRMPSAFMMAQNYPNPFNPTTTIRYDLLKQSRVSLKLFNLLGQEVMILVDTEQSAGRYSVELNGQNLASGVYCYRLQAGSFVETKKLAIVK